MSRRNMRIHLSGPQRRMAEQFLYDSEISATLKQVSGERMAQGVGRSPYWSAGLGKIARKSALNV
jgi:hypothetical protein